MVAVVSVVAGIATVATRELHGLFGGNALRAKDIPKTLAAWRELTEPLRGKLTRLKAGEYDLLGARLSDPLKLLRGKGRRAGYVQTIYGEPVAVFAQRDFPGGKAPAKLTLVQNRDSEYVYHAVAGGETLSWNGTEIGHVDEATQTLTHGGEVVVRLVPQRDGRTVHLDAAGPDEHTLAIFLLHAAERAVAPRAYEFVDLRTPEDRVLLEAMTYRFLLAQNSD